MVKEHVLYTWCTHTHAHTLIICVYVFIYFFPKEKFLIHMHFILCLSVLLFANVTSAQIGWIFTKFDFGDL
jgi:hypothetical protein